MDKIKDKLSEIYAKYSKILSIIVCLSLVIFSIFGFQEFNKYRIQKAKDNFQKEIELKSATIKPYTLSTAGVVYLGANKITNADFRTFEVLARSFNIIYAKDKDHVYINQRILDTADPNTFKVIDVLTYITQDKNNIYKGTNIVSKTNGQTLNAYPDNPRFVFDDKFVYHPNGKIIDGADPASFRKFNELGPGFYRDNNSVFWGFSKLENINPERFHAVSEVYFVDDSHLVYIPDANSSYRGDMDSDPYSEPPYEEEHWEYYSNFFDPLDSLIYDDNLRRSEIITTDNVDIGSFETFTWEDERGDFEISKYAKDKNHIYFEGKILENANPLTFKFIYFGYDPVYAKDDRRVYNYGRVILDADPNSFQIMTTADGDNEKWRNFGQYAKDRNHVYYNGELIEGVNPWSAKYLGCDYMKANGKIYQSGQIADYIDANTFVLTECVTNC